MSSKVPTSPLPLVQKAIWVESKESSTNVTLRHDVPVPLPGDYDVLVKVDFSGLCHSDVYNMTGAHPMDVHIAGHEGVGHVVQVGGSVPESGPLSRRIGQRVGIKWIHETCGDCAVCERDETLCDAQHNSGRDRPGTLQQYVVVPAKHASPIPDGVESKIAAPLLCAGLTMYSAIAKTNSRQNDWIVIQGAGGGLGHIGVQIAARQGFQVIAIDREEKREFCLSLGATKFFSAYDTQLEQELKRGTGGLGAHAAVCCVGAGPAYDQALRVLRRGGTLVCVGLPADGAYTIPLRPMDMVVRGLMVLGSSVGTEQQLQELLELARKGNIKPVIDVLPLDRFSHAIDMVKGSKALGRVVLDME